MKSNFLTIHKHLKKHSNYDVFSKGKRKGKKRYPKKNKDKPLPIKNRTDLVKSKNFLNSPEWLEIRYQVLAKYPRICMLCGAHGPKVTIQVDHIKPKIKYPELALDFNNLQLLCRECNLGKSYKNEDDFRPKT